MLWQVVYMAFNITPPSNITKFIGNWLNEVAKKYKGHIQVGVCAFTMGTMEGSK
jgi:hypothetical protein